MIFTNYQVERGNEEECSTSVG